MLARQGQNNKKKKRSKRAGHGKGTHGKASRIMARQYSSRSDHKWEDGCSRRSRASLFAMLAERQEEDRRYPPTVLGKGPVLFRESAQRISRITGTRAVSLMVLGHYNQYQEMEASCARIRMVCDPRQNG